MAELLPATGKHYVIDGKPYPRVTAILDVIAKPHLETWRRRIGMDEADRQTKEAAEYGTWLHGLLEGACLGEYGSESELVFPVEVEPAVSSFVRWFEANVVETLATERLVWHEGLKYAGTLDALLKLKDGRVVVVDFKTSSSVSPLFALQTIAYQAALMHQGEHVDGRLVVHLPRKDPGRLEVIEYTDHQGDWFDFKAALRLYRRFGES